jgi:hypothetical protein
MTTDLSARRDRHRAGGSSTLDHGMDLRRGGPQFDPARQKTILVPDPRFDLGGTGVPVGVNKTMKPERSNVEFATAAQMARDGPTTLGSIAGYGGHIQGKIAENIHSSTVQRANDLASVTRNRTPAWNQTPLHGTVTADIWRTGTRLPVPGSRRRSTRPGGCSNSAKLAPVTPMW